MIMYWGNKMGARLRLPHWAECYVVVVDIGTKYFVGQIFRPDGQPIHSTNVFLKAEDWQLYITLDDILDTIPVKRRKKK